MTSENNTPEAELDAALDALVNGADASASDDVEGVEAEADAAEVIETAAAEDAPAAETSDEQAEDPYAAFKLELRTKPGKWYVIHSYAGYERKVKSNLWNRRETMGAVDDIFETVSYTHLTLPTKRIV